MSVGDGRRAHPARFAAEHLSLVENFHYSQSGARPPARSISQVGPNVRGDPPHTAVRDVSDRRRRLGAVDLRPDLDRPFKVPFSPVLPIVSALACLYLMLNLSVETWLRFLAWMLLGGLTYFGYGYRRNRLARREAAPDHAEPQVSATL
ncbi:amino acid permease-like protein [Micromonospora kangleipakensis]|uniref:Amino acid permease-like protein n=1 Tax=Micromonospora kangleipakensis TaxID=1077942 RepID=A0A4Q8B2V4_9ACTN|nr:amino acid permease C-terminal domain-containing protein [Micromonospora kangleipakensis]RZU71810.1 amino acid permease-like protein [Micromonospora kangleipakensis]